MQMPPPKVPKKSNRKNRKTLAIEIKMNDSKKIERLVIEASKKSRVVRLSGEYLLDRAILLPKDTTLYLENCKLKLADSCRDNFIRSANAGIGIARPEPLENIRIIGIGNTVLEGATHPRATGDSGKILGKQTYGSDVGKTGENQRGDWRNIGILLVNVTGFVIENLTIRDSHCWGISLEHCHRGIIHRIEFDSTGEKMIDDKFERILNQDGLDIRQGCSEIIVDTITGRSGDDLVAVTGLRTQHLPGGVLESMMVGGTIISPEDDIHDIVINNITGRAYYHLVRFLNKQGIRMYAIRLSGVTDTAPIGSGYAAVRIGDTKYGSGITPVGETSGFIVSNIISRSKFPVMIAGSLSNAVISNVVNLNPEQCECVVVSSGPEYVHNITIRDTVNTVRMKS